MDRIELFGVGIDCLTGAEAVERAMEKRGTPCTVVTPNALMLERCRRDGRLAEILGRATLSLADGSGVLWAAKRKRTPLPVRVSGIDFGEAILARAAVEGLRVFLLGGGSGVAERAGEKMRERYPSLCICGSYWGYWDRTGEENEMLLEYIRSCGTDILLVCLGFPLQEEWMFESLDRLSSVRIIAGLGGSLDVWSGRLRRAPHVMRSLGMEWAWRMLREPRRLSSLPLLVRFVTHRRGTY